MILKDVSIMRKWNLFLPSRFVTKPVQDPDEYFHKQIRYLEN